MKTLVSEPTDELKLFGVFETEAGQGITGQI
jgi:hypothetical protein